MSPSSVRGIAEISSIRQNDGYLWTINFNKYHIKRNGMVFWFGLPKGQTPTGPVRFTTTDVNGHETSSSGTGDGRIKHYQECGILLVVLLLVHIISDKEIL